MDYAVHLTSCGMIYVQSFMHTDVDFQAILRSGLRNLRGLILVLLMGGIYKLRY